MERANAWLVPADGRLNLVREMAGGQVAGSGFILQRWLYLSTDGLSHWAARVETAPGGRIQRAGHITRQNNALFAHRWVRNGSRRKQRGGVWMFGSRVE